MPFYAEKNYFKSNTLFKNCLCFWLMSTMSCKPASKYFGSHWEYFFKKDFSVNFTTIWNFLNTVLFCEGLECMEVCSFMSMVSFFLPDLTFQCLLKPSILVSGSCKRRREIKAQKFRAHFYPEQYCFLEVKSSPADPWKVSLRRSVG